MTPPVLLWPPNHAHCRLDEIIQFQWKLASFGDAQMIRLALYVGRDSTAPYRDPGHITKTWLFTPTDPWLRFNETAQNLGLIAGWPYYWQIGQRNAGAADLLSETRAIHIDGQPATEPSLRFGFVNAPPNTVTRGGTPVNMSVGTKNMSDSPVRLVFPSRQHFAVSVYQLRGILSDKFVWSPAEVYAQVIDTIDLLPGETISKAFSWPQVDNDGDPVLGDFDYRIVGRCLADNFRAEVRHTCRVVLF
jgi:hypothetical protein